MMTSVGARIRQIVIDAGPASFRPTASFALRISPSKVPRSPSKCPPGGRRCCYGISLLVFNSRAHSERRASHPAQFVCWKGAEQTFQLLPTDRIAVRALRTVSTISSTWAHVGGHTHYMRTASAQDCIPTQVLQYNIIWYNRI
jgi:hypothetical protein